MKIKKPTYIAKLDATDHPQLQHFGYIQKPKI